MELLWGTLLSINRMHRIATGYLVWCTEQRTATSFIFVARSCAVNIRMPTRSQHQHQQASERANKRNKRNASKHIMSVKDTAQYFKFTIGILYPCWCSYCCSLVLIVQLVNTVTVLCIWIGVHMAVWANVNKWESSVSHIFTLTPIHELYITHRQRAIRWL